MIQCPGGWVALVLFFVNIPRIVCGCGGFIFPEYQVEHILAVVHAEFFNMSRTLSIGNEGPRAVNLALGPIYLGRNSR